MFRRDRFQLLPRLRGRGFVCAVRVVLIVKQVQQIETPNLDFVWPRWLCGRLLGRRREDPGVDPEL